MGALARAGLVLWGLATGLLGAVVHRHETTVGGVDLPWGLLLALVVTAAVARAAGHLVRVGAAWLGLGWTLAVVLQQQLRPGSYLVAGDVVGWSFMLLGLTVLAVVVVTHPGATGRTPPRGN